MHQLFDRFHFLVIGLDK